MTFTVLWSRHAEAKLAELWMRATDRQAVSAAANEIDQLLQESAVSAGESRSAGRRILHEPPLGVTFSVDVGECKVLVLDVWRYDVRNEQPS